MHRINPAKLLNSKWTARDPVDGERHFIVVELVRDEHDRIIGCELEAVINRRRMDYDWRDLRDETRWSMGWK